MRSQRYNAQCRKNTISKEAGAKKFFSVYFMMMLKTKLPGSSGAVVHAKGSPQFLLKERESLNTVVNGQVNT